MLTQADQRILELEQAYPRRTGLKTDRIIHDLKLSPARYHQRLLELVRMPEVVAEHPQLCSRVQRLARKRTADRAALVRMLEQGACPTSAPRHTKGPVG